MPRQIHNCKNCKNSIVFSTLHHTSWANKNPDANPDPDPADLLAGNPDPDPVQNFGSGTSLVNAVSMKATS